MTGCGCHDPIVFGHGWACEAGLGPVTAGGAADTPPTLYADYQALYGPSGQPVPRNWGKRLPYHFWGDYLSLKRRRA